MDQLLKDGTITMLMYLKLCEATKENKTVELYTKEQVVTMVAKFGNSYNTESFLGGYETQEDAEDIVKDYIEWPE